MLLVRARVLVAVAVLADAQLHAPSMVVVAVVVLIDVKLQKHHKPPAL